MGYLNTDGLPLGNLRAANVQRMARTPAFAQCQTWNEADWFMALAGEVGELANLLKKRKRGIGQVPTDKDIASEMADILIYLDLLAEYQGINLSEAVREKFNEVSARPEVDSPIRMGHDYEWRYRRARE